MKEMETLRIPSLRTQVFARKVCGLDRHLKLGRGGTEGWSRAQPPFVHHDQQTNHGSREAR